MPRVAAAVAGLNPANAALVLREGGTSESTSADSDHGLRSDDLLMSMKPLEGYEVEREGSHAVALELEVDDELRAEGWAREIVHAVQGTRRTAGLDISDRIVLVLDGDAVLLDAARGHQEYIAGETLAVEVGYESLPHVEAAAIDGLELRVAVATV